MGTSRMILQRTSSVFWRSCSSGSFIPMGHRSSGDKQGGDILGWGHLVSVSQMAGRGSPAATEGCSPINVAAPVVSDGCRHSIRIANSSIGTFICTADPGAFDIAL